MRNNGKLTAYFYWHIFKAFRLNVLFMRFFIAVVLWFLLFVISWPIALLVIFFFPVIWLIALPFRLVGVAIEGVFKLIKEILLFPFTVLSRSK